MGHHHCGNGRRRWHLGRPAGGGGPACLRAGSGGDPHLERDLRLPDDYEIPGFHAFACENEAMAWNFQVRHYADEARQARAPPLPTPRRPTRQPLRAGVPRAPRQPTHRRLATR